ncbi:battenin-like isoform X1 [Rhodnius prolixus]|uniref:Battenin n=1 Tax=Rhodnius prolixus TaxID=13249 RepID=A0A4P6D8Q9_RHOPR
MEERRQETPQERPKRWQGLKTMISFWMFGLCNNFGYVVMLSAAHDIMREFDETDGSVEKVKAFYKRECNVYGTGAILLADIFPSILIKLVAPFFPLFIHVRVATTVITSAFGFILVALKWNKWSIILGVILTSISSGLGETSLLAYTVFFKTKNVISTWSSGTGAAGLFGSFAYAALINLGLSPTTTLLSMLVSPAAMAFCFWGLVEHPKINKKESYLEVDRPTVQDKHTFKEKVALLPHLIVVYTAPFGLVYLFEYFVNQGLFELLYFPQTFLNHHSQYRWYQVLYQTGVFISRSSMNLVKINNTWLLAILQGLNLILLVLEVVYGYMRYLIIVMLVVLWEGLLGGASYVNTYRRIASEIAPAEREFSMAMNSFGDAVMITLAGIIAIPSHNQLCKLKSPYY